jgi:hypothetical protein
MKMILEKQMECRLSWETEVLGENVPQCHFTLIIVIIYKENKKNSKNK